MERFSLLYNRGLQSVINSLHSFSPGGLSQAREKESGKKMGQFDERDS
jgi:hypothetical protein